MSGSISFTVQCNDKTARISACDSDTVQLVMFRFGEECKAPEVGDATAVFVNDTPVEITSRIGDIGVVATSRLVIQVPERSGLRARGMFPFSSLESSTDILFTSNAPRHRWCVQGLNLEGVCQNRACAARGKNVILQIGLGEKVIEREMFDQKCPVVRCWPCDFCSTYGISLISGDACVHRAVQHGDQS